MHPSTINLYTSGKIKIMFRIKVYMRLVAILPVLILAKSITCAQKPIVVTPGNFKNPPPAFRPVSGNDGPLPSGNLINELNTALSIHGFGGYMFSPGKKGYLGEAYFDSLKVFLDYLSKTGHTAVFYDEVGFPSGSANKTIPSKYYRKELVKIEDQVSGPGLYSKEMPDEGWLMAVVAMNSEGQARIDLTGMVKDNRLEWNVPAGQWKVMVFNCAITKGSAPNLLMINYNSMSDPMDREAVEWFINTVYEPHAKHVGKYFGNTIRM
jgi:hypothetical protein